MLAGAIQGYYGGKIDLWGQRFIEVWSGMPTLFLIILLSSVVQPGFWWLLAITVLFGWMTLVGVVRAEFLRTRNYDYVRAAQALGLATGRSSCGICCPTRWWRPSPSCPLSCAAPLPP
nr:Inner membrane ABC transporter permease protein yejE [Klebsiella pneumoniae]